MLDLFNMPHLTDEGAKALAAGAEAFGARAAENLARATESLAKIVPSLAKIVPSQRTTLVVGGGLFLISAGWLALAFYRESKSGQVHHTVAHTRTLPPLPPAA